MSRANPGSVREALARVASLLGAGQPAKAIEFLVRCRMGNPELSNAYGVCLIRAGELDKAIDVYQGLCLNGSVCLKPSVPMLHLANYATALLLKGNVSGCRAMLRQASDQSHPAVRRLREAIRRWRHSLSWLQRVRLIVSDRPIETPIDLGFAPGELTDDAESSCASATPIEHADASPTLTSAVS